jgi:hypothetical protein
VTAPGQIMSRGNPRHTTPPCLRLSEPVRETYQVHVHSNETIWIGSHTHAHIKLTGCREPCRIPRQSAHPARHPHSPTPPLRQLM